jgi:hypothetical protein
VRGYDVYNLYAAFCVGCLRALAQAFGVISNLPVGHGGQTAQNVAEIGVGLQTVAAETLNDRVDDGTAFSRVGVSEKEPVLFLWKAFHKKTMNSPGLCKVRQARIAILSLGIWEGEKCNRSRLCIVRDCPGMSLDRLAV